jgi:hypothetical protein
MASFVGSSLVVLWVQASATTSLTGDYRTFNYAPSIELLEETAGADTAKQYVPYMKDGRITFTSLLQATSAVGGTVMTSTLTEGNIGTIKFSPEGTAAGKSLYTIPAISMGAALNIQYNNFTEVSVEWQQNGPRVEGTN